MNPRRLLLVAVVVAFAASLIVINNSTDPDLWGHLAFGRDIVHDRSLTASDRYSFTSDRPWVNHEWLAEVIMYTAYAAGGAPGLMALKLVLCALTIGVIVWSLGRHQLSFEARVFLLAVAVLGMKPAMGHIRPQLFSLLLFAILLTSMTEVDRGRLRAALTFPLIMLAWANLHGGLVVGLGTLAIWAGGFAFDWRRTARQRAFVLTMSAAGAVATLINPFGVGLWSFLWETVGLARPDIKDWQPMTNVPFSVAATWFVVAVSAIVLAVRARTALTLRTLVIVGGLAYASFRVSRISPFLAESVTLLFAAPLAAAAASAPAADGARRPQAPDSRAATLGVSAAALGAIVVAVVLSARSAQCIPIESDFPEPEAAAFVHLNNLRGRMLTWFDWGEYAIWHFGPELQVSMDGRRETVYTDATVNSHLRLYQGGEAGADAVNRLGADYAWLPKRLPVVSALRAAHWTPIFEGPVSIMLSPTSGQFTQPVSVTSQLPRCFPGP